MREPLGGALFGFFASRQLKLLHLVVPPHVFGATLAYIRGLAAAGPRPCPVRIVSAPSFGPSRGWAARARELDHTAFDEGVPLLDPLEAFARAVRREIDAVGANAGLVIVLAPQHVADVTEHARDVEMLVRRPDLAEVRWIVADAACSSVGDLTDRLGLFVARVAWVEIEPREHAELERRIGELAERAGRHELASRVEAPRQGDPVRELAEAEQTLRARGQLEQAAQLALQRARVLYESGAIEAAEGVLVSLVATIGEDASAGLLADAYGALGNVHVRRGRFIDAVAAYTRAASAADRENDRARSADLLRCAGHAALNANRPDEARRVWTAALERLEGTVPVTFGLDEPRQIVVLAIGLAEVFESRGNPAAARGLREHASAIEAQRTRNATTCWD